MKPSVQHVAKRLEYVDRITQEQAVALYVPGAQLFVLTRRHYQLGNLADCSAAYSGVEADRKYQTLAARLAEQEITATTVRVSSADVGWIREV